MEQADFFEAMEEAERFLPHVMIGTLVLLFVGAVFLLADAVLILGLIGILASTAGFIWVSLKVWPPWTLDEDD